MTEEKTAQYSWMPWALALVLLLTIAPLGAVAFYGERWLAAAVERGDAQTARWLLRFNPKWSNAKPITSYWTTLLGHAVQQKDAQMVESLLRAGAKASIPAENYIINSAAFESPETLETMLKAGLKPDDYDMLNQAYLRFGDKYRLMELLLQHGANPDAPDEAGMPLLHRVIFNTSFGLDVPVIELLLKAGADPNARDAEGRSALYYCWNPQSLEILLKAGADPNVVNNAGESPLFHATNFGNLANVEALLKAGADPLRKNNAGKTPLDITPVKPIQERLRQAMAEREISQQKEASKP